ncbi:MAG: type III secretion inner membrane ring lipoprotein SctJ [Parachlamydiales bacterium]|jgi:type III secretion protein J
MKKLLFVFFILIFAAGCETNHSIVNNVDEREANEIVVFLASKGIAAQKIQSSATETPGAGATGISFDIFVEKNKMIDAIALLNQNGLPRIKGTNLLELFAKQGLMTSDKEETIRYQSGLEEELKNTIRKIDGIIDADVKISSPSSTENLITPGETPKIKASVYIKHQGILDDPNQHLESKIKRLISGSIDNLSYDDVTIISDKSRFTDIKLPSSSVLIGPKALEREYVKIWSIIMTKGSASKFRLIFFSMILVIFAFAGSIGWLIYKFYPLLKQQKEKPKE